MQETRQRRDIQALRAIAVMLVVLNHLWPSRLTGGFIGVDVFFVISGFLITSHLLKELRQTKTISLPRFYARRARRLLPAALLVSTLSLIGTLLLLPVERWQRVAAEVFASTAYFENWLLAATSVNYYEQNHSATPVQHYWSLSVEEQFYLLWPVTLLLLAWWFARQASGRISSKPTALLVTIFVIAAASLAFSTWHTATAPEAAYFNTFGRVWEFMLGALLAAALPLVTSFFARHPMPHWRGSAQLIGYSAIIAAAILFTPSTQFPGPWALLPVVGTALVILTGPEIPRWSPAIALESRPVQCLGDISYSLYLWHWPIIIFAPFLLARDLAFTDRILLLVTSVLLAALTKHFVEDPGRTKLFITARPRRTLLAALASVVAIGLVPVGLNVWSAAKEAERIAELELLATSGCFGAEALLPGAACGDPFGPAIVSAGAESEAPWSAEFVECVVVPDARQTSPASLVECDFKTANADDHLKVFIAGDSHIEHWQPALYEIGREQGWHVTRAAAGGCPVVPVPLTEFKQQAVSSKKQQECLTWSQQISDLILEQRPDLAILSTFAAAETVDDGSGRSQANQLADGMNQTLAKWVDQGTRVLVIRDIPTNDSRINIDCVAANGQEPRSCIAPQEEVLLADPLADAVKLLDNRHVQVIDMTEYFCSEGICSGVIGSVPVLYDHDHLSVTYSRSLAPMLAKKMLAAFI